MSLKKVMYGMLVVTGLGQCHGFGAGEKGVFDPCRLADVAPEWKKQVLVLPLSESAPDTTQKQADAKWKNAVKIASLGTMGRTNILREDCQTSFQMVRSKDKLFLKFFARLPKNIKPKVTQTERDGGLWLDESVEIFVKSPQKKTQIIINAAGVVYDSSGEAGPSWNSSAKPEVWLDQNGNGWGGSVCLPLAELGAMPQDGEVWQFNFQRNAFPKAGVDDAFQVISSWSPVISSAHDLRSWGDLIFSSAQTPAVQVTQETVKDGIYTISGVILRSNAQLVAGLTQASGTAVAALNPVSIRQDGAFSGTVDLSALKRYLPVSFTVSDPARTLYRQTRVLGADDRIQMRAKPYPSSNRIIVDAILGATQAFGDRVNLTLLDRNAKVIRSATNVSTTNFTVSEPFDNLAPGDYTVKLELVKAAGATLRVTTSCQLASLPDWVKNPIHPKTFLKPWTPVTVNDHAITVWGRRIQLDRSGLPSSITSSGKELLSRPVKLKIEMLDGTTEIVPLSFNKISATDESAVFMSCLTISGLNIDLRTTIDYDGLISFNVTLGSGIKTPFIKAMSVVLPFTRESSAYLWRHRETDGRDLANYYEGMSASPCIMTTPDRLDSPFLPFLALCNDTVGAQVYFEITHGILLNELETGTVVKKSGPETVAEWKLIDQPLRLTKPVSFWFAILPTPSKPIPENWRIKQRLGYCGANWQHHFETPSVLPDNTRARVTAPFKAGEPVKLTFRLEPNFQVSAAQAHQPIVSLQKQDHVLLTASYAFDSKAYRFTKWDGTQKPVQSAEGVAPQTGVAQPLEFVVDKTSVTCVCNGLVIATFDFSDRPGFATAAPVEFVFGGGAWWIGDLAFTAGTDRRKIAFDDARRVVWSGEQAKVLKREKDGVDWIGFKLRELSKAEVFQEMGVTYMRLDEYWSNTQSYPDPFNQERLKIVLATAHAKGIRLLPYYGFEIANIAPEFNSWLYEVFSEPVTPFNNPYWGWIRDPHQADYAVSYSSVWRDYLLHFVDLTVNGKGALAGLPMDGIYFDGCGVTLGETYQDWNGKTWPTLGWRAYRDRMMRARNIVKNSGEQKLIQGHAWPMMIGINFVDEFHNGEFYGNRPGYRVPNLSFRLIHEGRIWGAVGDLFGGQVMWGERTPYALDEVRTSAYIHDTPMFEYGDPTVKQPIWEAWDWLGKDPVFFPYWSPGNRVTVLKGSVLASAYLSADQKRLVVVVGNQERQACVAELKLPDPGWQLRRGKCQFKNAVATLNLTAAKSEFLYFTKE